jgi:hypothetical protein
VRDKDQAERAASKSFTRGALRHPNFDGYRLYEIRSGSEQVRTQLVSRH